MADSSFKQQCPTCETEVLITDLRKVGKKMECPVCHDRFMVKSPGPVSPSLDFEGTRRPMRHRIPAQSHEAEREDRPLGRGTQIFAVALALLCLFLGGKLHYASSSAESARESEKQLRAEVEDLKAKLETHGLEALKKRLDGYQQRIAELLKEKQGTK